MNYKDIYKNIFKKEYYNDDTSESYLLAFDFLKKNKNITKICDIGSGRGNLIKKIINYENNYNINCYDLENFLDTILLNYVDFYEINISIIDELKIIKQCDLLFCLDVLEHIEEEYIDNILEIFSKKSQKVFLSIANHSDIIDDRELHLIQKNNIFWDEKILKFFNIINYEEKYGGRLMAYSLEGKI